MTLNEFVERYDGYAIKRIVGYDMGVRVHKIFVVTP